MIFVSCAKKKESGSDGFDINKTAGSSPKMVELASQRVELDNKGVGPIKRITLDSLINQELAATGKEIYEKNCTICHKVTEKFIGPAPKDILKRRSPEWVMNMILNPDRMIKEDPLAGDLFMEFNGSPMTNQNLTEEEARAILEYFRTL